MSGYKPSIGSISHGTLKTADLLSAFADELDRIETDRDDVREARAVITLIEAEWSNIEDREETAGLLTELIDALNENAPPFTYFGPHEGDGSDYGFWPDVEAINETCVKVSDPADVEGKFVPCVFVNDHGNMTVYDEDGVVIWDCV